MGHGDCAGLSLLNLAGTVPRKIHMCDMIEKEMLSHRKTVYTLKTAP